MRSLLMFLGFKKIINLHILEKIFLGLNLKIKTEDTEFYWIVIKQESNG